MSKIPLKDQVIWVTGASKGIGRACALEFAARGAKVALSARSEEELNELAAEIEEKQGGGLAMVCPLDITDRAANGEAVRKIVERFNRLDVAFLNAGTHIFVEGDNIIAEPFEKLMNINYLGMVYGIEAAIPELEKAENPQLVGMSSSVAYAPLPRASAYGSSKAAIKYLMDTLHIDLKPRGIHVSVVCPGFVKTPLTDQNDFDMPARVSAEWAAEFIADSIERRKQEIHFPKRFTLTLKAFGLLPYGIYNAFASKMIKKGDG